MVKINEDAYEQTVLGWLSEVGYEVVYGPDIAFDGDRPERESARQVILPERLEAAIKRINPGLPIDVVRRVVQKLDAPGETDVIKANQLIQSWFAEGIPEIVRDTNGEESVRRVWLIDFTDITNNEYLAVNQLSVEVDAKAGARRPDVVIYLNGLPISVIELKNPADKDADIWQAYNQLQTYKEQISRLFYYNSSLVIADGVDARVGSLTANRERFMMWRSVDGIERDPFGQFLHTKTLIHGLYAKDTVVNLIRNYTVFVTDRSTYKMMPGYHQYFAVQKAYQRAVQASGVNGDRRGGLMWHTQGAGKSFEMSCLTGMLVTSLELQNPTVIVVTDRNDLDGQLFDTFVSAKSLMRDTPVKASSREELRQMIAARPSGGVIFTTIQKFALDEGESKFPALTDRTNVFVLTDEAHRSQYGFAAKIDRKTDSFKVGYAQHLRDALPNATFIAFTGTPISKVDKDTRQVFGDEIDVYDFATAIEDGATVPIYYENRLVKIDLPDEAKDELDLLAEGLVEDEEDNLQASLKQKWAALEAIVGSQPRLEQIAKDFVEHFENRLKSPELEDSKAMVVGMSRNICVDLYNEIIKLRPHWHSTNHREGVIKIVFHSSASDDEKLRPHAYTQPQKKDLEQRFKDPTDPLKIVIVRDMWLVGYDSQPCATMYVDKPMRGANLMQAIARVNRVFKNKPGGLIVDYIGIGTDLKEAMRDYTQTGKKVAPVLDIDTAIAVFNEKLIICQDMLTGCDYSDFSKNPVEAIAKIADFVLGLEDGVKRFSDASTALSRAYALVNSKPEAIKHREEVALLQAARTILNAKQPSDKPSEFQPDREAIIRQALSNGIVPHGVIDVFEAAGLDKPNIGLLSEEFLNQIKSMKERNLAAEALKRLIETDIKSRFKSNIVKNLKYSELLEGALARYRNRSIETAQLIEELIALAKQLNEEVAKGNPDGLNEQEIAFYDALESNEEAVRKMKHEDLVKLALELTKEVKANVRVDWSVRESTQAALRVMVRDILDRYGYPPDFQKEAADLIIQQAEALTEHWLESENR
jgi:type I restriction enzyme R subunit